MSILRMRTDAAFSRRSVRRRTRALSLRSGQTAAVTPVSSNTGSLGMLHFPCSPIAHGGHRWDVGTFGAGRRRREIFGSSPMRTHAQPHAEVKSPRTRLPHTAKGRLSHSTVPRSGALPPKSKRSLPAYGLQSLKTRSTESYIQHKGPGGAHRPATRRRLADRRPVRRSYGTRVTAELWRTRAYAKHPP